MEIDDFDTIISQIEDKDERMRLKRRWLLGLEALSESTKDHSPENNTEYVPESLLREDDLFYETIKFHLEDAFGFFKHEQLCNDFQPKDSKFCTLEVVRHLKCFTNKGLHLIATILKAGDSTSFDKTRCKMKEIIRDLINKDFGQIKDYNSGKEDIIINQLHQVLSDPTNFRDDCTLSLATTTTTLTSPSDAAMKILNGLDILSSQTLRAMKRKLHGSKIIPTLEARRFGGKNKTKLMNQVRLASEKMLSELSVEDNLPEKLAKALSLVDLSFKIGPGYKTTAATDIFQFSPETKNLQNDIVKAVWLLPQLKPDELKRLHLCLDPEVEVSNKRLRPAVKKMLIEYLYECGDMDPIPKSLMDALSLVNQRTQDEEHEVDPREAIKEEMECILNVSAELKQIFCQCIPNYELDQDFDDAYMEELVDSDGDDDDGYMEEPVESCNLDHEESGAECLVLDPTESTHASSSDNRMVISDLTESIITRVLPRSLNVTPTSNKSSLMGDRHDLGSGKTRVKDEVEVDNQSSSQSLFSVQNINSDDRGEQEPPRRRNKNQYLAVQEIADETSLFAHNLIGGLLEKLADSQGLELEAADERAYLRGQSKLQKHKESAPAKKRKKRSGNKQGSSSQEKSDDESIIVSVVREQMPSLLDESVLMMKLKELLK